jgi:hypothetical protein
MKVYIGAKIISATPVDECTFLKVYKNQNVDDRETRPGYLVRYPDGYLSWSPKETFEEAYREVTQKEFELIASPAGNSTTQSP